MPLTVSQHKHLETKGAYARNLGLLNIKSRTEVSCTTECDFVNSCLFGFPYCAAPRERSAVAGVRGSSVPAHVIFVGGRAGSNHRAKVRAIHTDNRDYSITMIFEVGAMAGLTDLPQELFCLILTFLPKKALSTLSFTSKYHRALVEPELYREIR